MKSLVYTFLLLAITGSFLSCASSFHSISPERMPYTNLSSDGGVAFGYRYDVLNETSNKKYAKRELKNGVKLVAISVTNNTDKPLKFGTDIKVYNGSSEIIPMSTSSSFATMKQNTPAYLLYALLTFLNVYVDKPNNFGGVERTIYPVGLIVGPAVTIGNVAVSGSANKKFKAELFSRDIMGREIAPGTTAYGLMGLGGRGYDALSVKVVNNN